jgi:PAS domain S-box-containing protein
VRKNRYVVKKGNWLGYPQLIPSVLFFAIAAISATTFPTSVVYEPAFLLPLLNSAFLAAMPFFIAFLAARSYVRQGSRMLVLFGCGMVAFGLGSLLGGWGLARYGQNFNVTLFNIGSLLSGLCQLGGVSILLLGPTVESSPLRRRATSVCVMGYSAFAVFLVAVSLLTIKGYFPHFFTQGQGPTLVRQLVLALATIAYALSAIQIVVLYAQTGMRFLSLYANGLFLMAIGLGIVLSEQSVGNLLSWTGRASQYAGSVYFMAAMLAGIRETQIQGTTLSTYLSELFRSHIDDQVRIRTKAVMDLNRKLQDEIAQHQVAEAKVHELEKSYRLIIENSLQGVAIIQDGAITLCNEALCRMSGYSAEEACRMTQEQVLATMHPEDRPAVIEGMRAISNTLDRRPAQIVRLMTRAGELRWIEMLCAPTTYRERPALQLSYVDVTDKRRAEAAYRSLIDHALYGMAILQMGRVVFANQALADISGYSVAELLRLTPEQISEAVYEEDRKSVLAHMSERLAGREAPSTHLFRFIRKDGSVRWVETQSTRVDYEKVPAVQVSYKDVTASRAAEEQLRQAHTTLRNLAAHLLHAREEERRKVAQDIHDDLGQTLAALKMDLHWIAKRLGGDVASLRDKVKGTIQLGEQAINTVQRIASDLRPRMLDDLGLEPALQWLVADFTRQTKIACKAIVDVPPWVIGRNAATALYRVVQEALTNIRRHSNADHAVVRLIFSDGVVILQIEDDGIGITEKQTTAPGSYGLIGLRERVEGLGGSLSISGEPGFGTILLARIPLPVEGTFA